MKFGLFYELSVPRPWTRESERTVYQNALEQVQLADELGFDQVWAVEHHFLEEYSHCPAPELFLTACAMITKKIRVGHGIVICVPEFNHPIKIAERTAVLDILSGGRLEVGTGRSATWTELGGFRANPDTTKKSWDEFVRCLPKMWTQETFFLRGRVLVHARADDRPEGVPAAAPAAVGRGDLAGHRARRRRSRPRQPRTHVRSVRGAGKAHRGIPAAHPELRAGRRVRQRPGQHGELPLLPRGRHDGTHHRPAHGGHVQLPRLPAHLRARGVPQPLVPVARSVAAAAAPGDRARRHRAGRRGARVRRPAAGDPRAQALGGGRRRPRELPDERDGGDPAGGRAREPPAVRQGSHAGFRGRQAGQRRAGGGA